MKELIDKIDGIKTSLVVPNAFKLFLLNHYIF